MYVRTGAAAVAVLFFTSTAGNARADGPTDVQIAQARAIFTAATQEELAGSYDTALAKLKQVDAVRDTAGVRFHIANCEEHIGRLAEALADFTDARNKAEAEGNKESEVLTLAPARIDDLEARVPRLTLDVPPDLKSIARIVFDGAVVDPAKYGTEMILDPGDHKIEGTATGRLGFSQTLTMAERHAMVFTVKLPPATEPAPVPAPIPGSATPPIPATGSAPATLPASSPTQSSGGSHTGAIVATVGAVVLLGAGIGSFFLAGSAHDDGVTQCATRTTSCDDLRAPVQAWDAVALGTWIGAAALGTLAVVLWTSSGSAPSAAEPKTTPASASVTVRAAPGSLVLGGTF